jgi:sialate O-acetylesterase
MKPAGHILRLVSALLLSLFAATAAAAPVLAPLFRDGAVLQREKPVPVWGRADAGEKITVRFRGHEAGATADKTGNWLAVLPPLPASAEPAELTVSGRRQTATVRDVLVGEVWLCSGQSNMRVTVAEAANPAQEAAAANYPRIRVFTVPAAAAPKPAFEAGGRWVACAPEVASQFSAVAYYFGRELHERLGVPVGLVVSALGGTTIEPWMSLKAHMADPAWPQVRARGAEDIKTLEAAQPGYQKELAAWENARALARKAGEPFARPRPADPRGLYNRRHPAGLFNGMIAPLVPCALRGVIWYQGESNESRPDEYRTLFPSLIRQWRADFAQGDLPFYYVELAGYAPGGDSDGELIPLLRDAQKSALALPNTARALATDIGDAQNVHPLNKQEVGRRLARIAFARDYGLGGVWRGPEFAGFSITGDAVRARFEHADGLHLRDAADTGFELAGADGWFYPASARIEGAEAVLASPRVPAPVAVRHAWKNCPVMSLYNGAGLPAGPFRAGASPAPRPVARAAVAVAVVSVLDAPPPGANINQPLVYNTDGTSLQETTEGVQARHRAKSATDAANRSVTQTFAWGDDGGQLAGIGIMVAPDQGVVCKFNSAQDWVLDVHELDNARKVTGALASASFTLTPALVQPGRYVYARFAAPVAMQAGRAYGFNLRPASHNSGNILLVAHTQAANGTPPSPWPPAEIRKKYPGVGFGNQEGRDGVAAFPAGREYRDARYSLTFFTTTTASITTTTTASTDAVVAAVVGVARTAQSVPDGVSAAAVRRAVLSGPDTYFTYTHENGFWRENGPGADWALVVASGAGGGGNLRLDRFDPAPPVPSTKPLLVTERMRIYYAVADEKGLVYYTRQTSPKGGPPAAIYEGNLRTGANRLVYAAPAGWQISQSCNLDNAAAHVFARIYKMGDDTDNKVLRIRVGDGAAETLVAPPFLADHVHCSPFDNDRVLYCKSVYGDRMYAWHPRLAPQGGRMFSEKDARGRALFVGHERATFHGPGAITVAFRHSPGLPRGLYEAGFDGSFRCVSESPEDWHCNISRDGRWAVVDTQEAGGDSRIVAINFTTGARHVLCHASSASHPWHPHPHISPDNRWVVFNDAKLKKVVALEIDQDWLAAFAKAALPEIIEFDAAPLAPGARVVIKGDNFRGVTAVRFGGADAVEFRVNDVRTELAAVVPAAAPASGKITVIAAAGTVESEDGYTLAAPSAKK